MLSQTVTISKPVSSFTKQEISIPGSKYIANRLLVIAGLAEGDSVIHNIPNNKDIEVVGQGMEALGAKIEKKGTTWSIQGTNGKIKQPSQSIYTGENGTFSRFVVSIAALGNFPIGFDSAPRMKERPMKSILQALTKLGVVVESSNHTFPLTITGPLYKGEVTLKGNTSSQYFSSLALTLPYARSQENSDTPKKESHIHIPASMVSKSYLKMTLNLMKEFGIKTKIIQSKNSKSMHDTIIIPSRHYQAREYTIEADPVSATYFMAMAALSSESLLIRDYNSNSSQGEAGFPKVLEKMGCRVSMVNDEHVRGIKISPPLENSGKQLKGIEIDMSDMPDAVQTLAIVAANATGKTCITGIAHLRHKESNRVEDTAHELRKAGIKVKTGNQFMEIEGGSPCPALFDSHNDHRMAMSFSLLCLRSQEVKIKNYQAVNKSFPYYFDQLKKMGFKITP